jgi:hypothetical protein
LHGKSIKQQQRNSRGKIEYFLSSYGINFAILFLIVTSLSAAHAVKMVEGSNKTSRSKRTNNGNSYFPVVTQREIAGSMVFP